MHLYLHVPFCARRCSYCDFAIAVRRETPSVAFRDALLKEWAGWLNDEIWQASPEIRTVYFGGGTPSRLSPAIVGELLGRIRADRSVAGDAEITLETNPDDVTADRAEAWLAAGVNRISLGVQSLDPAVLAWMHRTHTTDQVAESVRVLRRAGLTNLSIDLIYALPRELGRDWQRDLNGVLAFEPEHLSLYGLTVEQQTPLGRWVARGESHPAPDGRAADEYLLAHEQLEASGFEHYEVSNAALPGRRSRHNSAYWNGSPFLGLGPSAHSGAAGVRWWNVREWADYLERIETGQPVLAGRERLDPRAQRLEEVYLGLRSDAGLDAARLSSAALTAWISEGWAVTTGARARLTPEGWLRLDALVAALPDP